MIERVLAIVHHAHAAVGIRLTDSIMHSLARHITKLHEATTHLLGLRHKRIPADVDSNFRADELAKNPLISIRTFHFHLLAACTPRDTSDHCPLQSPLGPWDRYSVRGPKCR